MNKWIIELDRITLIALPHVLKCFQMTTMHDQMWSAHDLEPYNIGVMIEFR